MKRTIKINKGYCLDDKLHIHKKNVIKKYEIKPEMTTTGENIRKSFVTKLPTDIDIFEGLPSYVYQNENAKHFLNVLRSVLSNKHLTGITLAKLCVGEISDSEVEIDWIYNYFRVYFSFSDESGSVYGKIYKNQEKGICRNETGILTPSRYKELAEEILNEVVRMIQG